MYVLVTYAFIHLLKYRIYVYFIGEFIHLFIHIDTQTRVMSTVSVTLLSLSRPAGAVPDGPRPVRPDRVHGLLGPRVPDAEVRDRHGQVPRQEHVRHPLPAQQRPPQPLGRPHAAALRRREDLLCQVSGVHLGSRERPLLLPINRPDAMGNDYCAISYCTP